VRSRLEGDAGISYTEFSYMLLQANDFRHLHAMYGVELQMGGSDQWGNITAGIDLIRRTTGQAAHGLTWPLLLRSDGQKFGKTAGGAVWLDPQRTSPYQFRQFWVQTDDADVASRLRWFSTRALEEVEAVLAEHAAAPERRTAQRALARELTELVHGTAAADAADAAADVLFGADPTAASEAALEVVAGEVPTTSVTSARLADASALGEVLVDAGLASSKSEARRLVDQRGVRANGHTLAAEDGLAATSPLHNRWILLRKGKHTYHLLEISPGQG
jgi:tyrosyl-tRNA synthetase